MATATKRNVGRGRSRVSSQRSQVNYAGKKAGRGGVKRVRSAKRAAARKTVKRAGVKRARSGR